MANNVMTPQIPSAPCQPYTVSLAMGEAIPDASVADILIDTEYRPVINPICKGKLSLRRLGNRTFANAIPTPIKNVPISSNVLVPIERMMIPSNKIIIA